VSRRNTYLLNSLKGKAHLDIRHKGWVTSSKKTLHVFCVLSVGQCHEYGSCLFGERHEAYK
jgi:hypothetical protein